MKNTIEIKSLRVFNDNIFHNSAPFLSCQNIPLSKNIAGYEIVITHHSS